ncbi:MAG: hypothetical protein N3B17_05630 [Chlorobi bacterium]|jgi:hypothetical protein|nr:hypothetical protein [Chlorobiota bacterium]
MNAYDSIMRRLRATRRKETLVLVGRDLVAAVATSAAVALVAAAVESLAHGGIPFRTVLAAIWAVATLGAVVLLPLRTLWLRVFSSQRPTLESIARRVGDAYADVRDRLLNALQLVQPDKTLTGSHELALAAFAEVERAVADRSFDVIIGSEHRRRLLVLLLLILGLVGAIVAIPPLGDAAYRIAHWYERFVPPPPFTLRVEPTSAEVLRNAPVRISVDIGGVVPLDVKLYVREEQQERPDYYPLRHDTGSRYILDLPALKSTIEFYAAAQWYDEEIRSNIGRIVVSDYPMVRSFQLRIEQPAYARRPAILLDETGADIVALRGSRAMLRVLANKPIVGGSIVYVPLGDSAAARDTLRIPLRADGERAEGSFVLSRSGTWWIELRDSAGRTTPDPIRYTARVESDAPPTIALVEPTQDATVGRDAVLPIRVTIGDDYGFSRLVLKSRLVESRYAEPERDWRSTDIPLPSLAAGTLDVPYAWNLNLLGISPQDKYEFYLEVFDNDVVSGPKSARTATLRVRLPSLEEVFRSAQQAQRSTQQQLEEVKRKAEELARSMDEIQRELMKQQQPNWQTEKSLENALRQQEQLQQKLQEAQRKLEEMTRMLEEHKAISPETLQKYLELQKLLQQVDSEELRRAIEEMQRAMQQLTPQDIERAMRNFRFDEEQFRKNVERAIELLKRIQAQQKMDELQRRAEQLAEQQRQLEQQTQNTNPNDKAAREQLARQQEQLQREMERLQEEFRSLEQLSQDAKLDQRKNVQDQLRQAAEQLQQEQSERSMEQSEQSLQQGDFDRARQHMQRSAERMQRFAQAMQRAKQEMRKNEMRQIARQMQQALQDLAELSKEQEQLANETQRLDPNSAMMNRATQRQQQLREQLMNLARRLDALSKQTTAVTPEMARELGQALRQMQDAQRTLEQRNSFGACQMQQSAMGSMNRAMNQMQAMLEQLNGNNPGEGEGEGDSNQMRPGGMQPGASFMQRLMEAAGMQQQINNAMQQLGAEGQLSQEQREQLGRIAAQQGRVMKSIEELAREEKEVGGKRKALGDLDRIADDMREVLTDMKSGTITPETRRRMDRILSRLLDASRSMHERDYEKTRESRPGEDVARQSPSELRLKAIEQLQRYRDFLRQSQLGYTKDYEQLIERYMEQLQRTQSK